MSGFFDVIADMGISGTGFEKARMAFEKDARDKALEELKIEEQKRRDAEAAYQAQALTQARDIAATYGVGGANQIPGMTNRSIMTRQPQVIDPNYNEVDGPGIEVVNKATPVPSSPAMDNEQGRAKALEKFYRDRLMDPKMTAELEKARKHIEDEGYKDFLNGVIEGDSPESIREAFNRTGKQRITAIAKNDNGSYAMEFEDGSTKTMDAATARKLGEMSNIFKKPESRLIPPGYKLERDGVIVNEGNEKPVNYRTTKEGMEEEYKFKQGLAAFKNSGTNKDTAVHKNIEEIAGTYFRDLPPDEARDRATEMVYGLTRKSEPLEKRVARQMTLLRNSRKYMMADDETVRDAATTLIADYDTKTAAADPRVQAAKAREAAGGADAPAPAARSTPAPKSAAAATDGADIDTPQNFRTDYTHPTGRVVKWNQIVATAKSRGISTQQVIRALGLARPNSGNQDIPGDVSAGP